MSRSIEKLRAIVVDDEPAARKYLSGLLADVENVLVIAECADGQSAIEDINRLKPDVVFLDIELPGMTVFEALGAITVQPTPAIIFVTAYDHYALKAFDSQAIGYITKPYGADRLAAELDRAREVVVGRRSLGSVRSLVQALGKEDSDAVDTPGELPAQIPNEPGASIRLKRLSVRTGKGRQIISVDKIDWIKSVAPYVEISSEGRRYLLRQKISWLEERLDTSQFVRIHRTCIVKVGLIKEIKSLMGADLTVILDNGERLPLSRRRRKTLERALGAKL